MDIFKQLFALCLALQFALASTRIIKKLQLHASPVTEWATHRRTGQLRDTMAH